MAFTLCCDRNYRLKQKRYDSGDPVACRSTTGGDLDLARREDQNTE